MTLALYGHPFSSYTWKALIPLYACEIPFTFHMLDETTTDTDAWRFVTTRAGPLGKFPVLADGAAVIFEATSIIEHLVVHQPRATGLIPADADAAVQTRMLDRVFDNYVMNVVQGMIGEYIFKDAPDPAACRRIRDNLERTYDWLERWLAGRPAPGRAITLVECAAAPSLFYADWVHEITARWPRLKAWRAHLNALPAVARCIDEARPWRPNFPLGAPDRD
ncbi:MAG: glutathione S-transferase family protein [Sphingomonadales bacterium]|nr:glutathione S-transferase family protein [Sphingomonadales bacterium]